MKIYFYRNTHDENGQYRGETYFGMTDWIKDFHNRKPMPPEVEWERAREFDEWFSKQQLPFGVDVWHGSGEQYRLTFDEIYRRIWEMYKGGAADWPNEMPNDERHTVESMLKALSFMVEKKLVVVQLVDDGVDSPKFELRK
jgi:hypothetical protein